MVEIEIIDKSTIKLDESSRDVSNHVAGYIAFKARKLFKKCCGDTFISTNGKNDRGSSYTSLLSRGGLVTPNEGISEAVATSFALLDVCSSAIRISVLPSRMAGLLVLQKYVDVPSLGCETHEKVFSSRLLRTVCNCFFDSQRKRSNETVVDDRVRSLKKSKRCKD